MMRYLTLCLFLIACQSHNTISSKHLESEDTSENPKCKFDSLSKYTLINQEGKTLHFSDIIQEDYALLLTYNDFVCRPCLEHYFYLLNEVFDDSVKNKIVLVARSLTPRTILVDAQKSGFKSYNLQSDEECLDIKGFVEQYPRLILINSDLEILNNRYGFAKDSISNPQFQEIVSYLK